MVVRTRRNAAVEPPPTQPPDRTDPLPPPAPPAPPAPPEPPMQPARPRVIPSDDEIDAQESVVTTWRPIITMPRSPTAAAVAAAAAPQPIAEAEIEQTRPPVQLVYRPPVQPVVIPDQPPSQPDTASTTAATARLVAATPPVRMPPSRSQPPLTAWEATIREHPFLANAAPPTGYTPLLIQVPSTASSTSDDVIQPVNDDSANTSTQPGREQSDGSQTTEQDAASAASTTGHPNDNPSTPVAGEALVAREDTPSTPVARAEATLRRSPRLERRSSSPPLSAVLKADRVAPKITPRTTAGFMTLFLETPITTRAGAAANRHQYQQLRASVAQNPPRQQPRSRSSSPHIPPPRVSVNRGALTKQKRKQSSKPAKRLSKKRRVEMFGSDDDDDDGNDDDFEEVEDDDQSADEDAEETKKPTQHPRKKSAAEDVHPQVQSVETQKTYDGVAPQGPFASWDAVNKYMKTFGKATKQKVKIIETGTIEKRRKAMQASWKTAKDSDSATPQPNLPPTAFTWYKKVYSCTHGGSERKTRGKYKRTKRHLSWMGCPYRFVVQLEENDDETGWELQVRGGVYEHNHKIGEEAYRTYASERGIASAETDARVDTMIDARAKPSYIYNFLLEKGENVTKRDVENRIAKQRKTLSNTEDNESVAQMIAKFAAEDPLNMVSVDETEREHTGVISFTTATMRATYARFPELLLVDCTHKTNRYNYQLCTFMVIDEHGAGRPVQHSLFETNSDWHMMCALRHFTRAHPTSENELKVVMVDKDLNEIRVIGSRFPLVQVLICTFHVKKYLAHVSRKAVYGRISAEDHDQLDHHLHFCVYAQSPDDYAQRLEDLRAFCKRVNFSAFFDYYMKNWDNCQRMWVEYFRNKLPFFRVNTNNHLESFFGKFKEGITSEISMTECLSQLFANERIRENEMRFTTNRVGTYVNYNYHDQEMKTVLRFTTHFVAENIAREYARAKAKVAEYAYDTEEDGDFVQVQGRSTAHRLNSQAWTCSCSFATNMKLPCRHAIAYRIHNDFKPLIPLEAVDLRWSRIVHNIPRVAPFAYSCSRDPPKASQRRLKTRQDRFNEAHRFFESLCGELAEISDEEEFTDSLLFVKDQWYNVRLRKRVTVKRKPIAAAGGDDHNDEDDEDAEGDESAGVDEDNEDESEGGDYERGGGADDDEDEPEVEDEPTDDADTPMPLSQAHSLYSADLGRVPVLSTHGITIPQPLYQVTASQDAGTTTTEADVPPPKARRSLALRILPEDYDASADPYFRQIHPPPINFNSRVSSVGRNPLNRDEVESTARQERIIFNTKSKSRRANGNISLVQLLDALDSEKPSLENLQKRLIGVMESNAELVGSRPKLLRQRNPIVVEDVYYYLPKSLLKKCFKILPLANEADDAISIASSSQSTSQGASQRADGAVEVIQIKNLLFRRVDIETMERAQQLKDAATSGLALLRWLRVIVAARVPADLQESVRAVAEQVASMYPTCVVQGLRHELHYGVLWRMKPPAWFNDAIMLAFFERLSDQFGTFRNTAVQRTTPASTLTQTREFSTRVRECQAFLLRRQGGELRDARAVWRWEGLSLDVRDCRQTD